LGGDELPQVGPVCASILTKDGPMSGQIVSQAGVRSMNPIVFAIRRPFRTIMLVVALLSAGALGLSRIRPDLFAALNTPKTRPYLDYIGRHATRAKDYIVGKYESYVNGKKEEEEEGSHQEEQTIVVTSPMAKTVTITESFVCQIHSQRHINIRALVGGYLQPIQLKEGQAVKKDQVVFEILPILYEAKFNAEKAEAELAQLEYDYTKQLNATKVGGQSVVSDREVLLLGAKRDHALAKADLARAERDFTKVKAPFDGIINRLLEQQGSLIKEGDILTTLSDNKIMWVYFNVPEKRYLEYKAELDQGKDIGHIELKLANGKIYTEAGRLGTVTEKDGSTQQYGAIEGQFNNETGNIAFRADFLNPKGLLRHGQTGTILISKPLNDAIVIPQRATFEILNKRYVWVLDEEDKAHQKLITVEHEQEDIFVISKGLEVQDRIVLEGVRQMEQDKKLEGFEFRKPEDALKNQKFRAE
jgi:membrane fusion protein, multidrug efflux system